MRVRSKLENSLVNRRQRQGRNVAVWVNYCGIGALVLLVMVMVWNIAWMKNFGKSSGDGDQSNLRRIWLRKEEQQQQQNPSKNMDFDLDTPDEDWKPQGLEDRHASPSLLSEADCQVIASTYHRCKEGIGYLPTEYNKETKEVICRFSLKKHTTYFPSREIHHCLHWFPPTAWRVDAQRFQKTINDLQNPSDCNKPKSKAFYEPVWTFGKDSNGEVTRVKGEDQKKDPTKPKWELIHWLNHGWAYNLYVFAWNCANHWQFDIPVITGHSKYRFSDLDCGRGYSCELSRLSTCSIDEINHENILVFGIGENTKTVMTYDQVCKPNGVLDHGRCRCNQGFLPQADPKYTFCRPYSAYDFSIVRKRVHKTDYEEKTEEALKGDIVWFANNAPGENNPHNTFNKIHFIHGELRKRHGFIWHHAQALYYLMRNPRTKRANEKIREDLGLVGSKCLAIHVRHGDSCHDKFQKHRACFPLKTYMEYVKKMDIRYGKYDKIFLATDDEEIIEETKQFSNEYQFVYQKHNRKFYEAEDHAGVDVRRDFNNPAKVREITTDIWLMGHCHGLVASFASSVAWVAYEFQIARHGYYVPYASIDLPMNHKYNIGRFHDKENL